MKTRIFFYTENLEERYMQLQYQDETIQVHIERSRRKTLCLMINKDGSVTAKAPHLFPTDKEIEGFVIQKAEWIIKQRNRLFEREEQRISREFKEGLTLPYLGEEKAVQFFPGKKIRIYWNRESLVVESPDWKGFQNEDERESFFEKQAEEKLKKELKKWYKKQGKDYITKRVDFYKDMIGVTVTDVSIKSRKSQWGSCDSKGLITFSWRLVMAAPKAIDYVVVHELCHRKYMDHSQEFWKEVAKYMPDFKEQKDWLEEHSVNLNI